MNSLAQISVAICILVLSSGCGRYGSPVSPEATAPATLVDLTIEPAVPSGLRIKWSAPKEEVQGRPLRSVGGYKVFRAEVSDPALLKSVPPDFVQIADQPDKFFVEVQKKNPLALRTRFPTRRFGVSQDLRKHEFIDETALAGKLYFYKIVGESTDQVEGTPTYFQVLFDGAKSIVRRVPASAVYWTE